MSTTVAVRSRARPRMELAVIVALAVLAAAVLWWRYVGYQGHDDASYARAALQWVTDFPPLGADHWALRYTLVLPIAGLIALSGPSVAALAIPNLLAFAAVLVVGYLALRRWFGWPAAAILTGIYALLPQFPVQATYANPDLMEMAFVLLSFWALMLARARRGAWGWMFVSGLLAGLGFLTRETTLAILVLYGLLFLFRPGVPRMQYVVMGLGFLLLVGGQAGYFAVRTGDPLYRERISATHDTVDRTGKLTEAQGAGRALDSEGALAVSPWLAPFATVFVSQKYGLLFLLAIPGYAILAWQRRFGPAAQSVVHCAALGALVTFLFVAVNAGILYVVPRYFMVPAALAAVPVAVLSASWLAQGGVRRVLATLVLLAFAVTSAGLLYLENTDPMMAEERIVRFAAGSSEAVHIDPETARRIRYLLIADGLQDRVSLDPPGPGQLVATEDGVVPACLRDAGCGLRGQMLPFQPGPGWTVVSRMAPPVRPIGGLLDLTGMGPRIPADIRRKIVQPGVDAVIYRTPAS